MDVKENGCSTFHEEASIKHNCDIQDLTTRTANCIKENAPLNKNGFRIVKSERQLEEQDSVNRETEQNCSVSSDIDYVIENQHTETCLENDSSQNCENKLKNSDSNVLKSDSTSDAGAISSMTSESLEEKHVSNALQTLSIEDNQSEKTIVFVPYKSEEQLPDLVALITIDLSEPYSIYTYRYFLHNWPHLSHLAYCGSECVGAIVCKLDVHRKSVLRGYIAMLVVHKSYRRCKIGSSLVRKAIKKMIEHGCDEVVLETEVTNKAALELYENLGFVRDKRLLRYYLNGVDAWRLKLWLK